MPRIYDTPQHKRNRKRLRNRPCADCGAVGNTTVEHIKPVSQGRAEGWTDAQLNHPSNVKPLCKSCNSRGGAGITNRLKRVGAVRRRRKQPNVRWSGWL